jgi:hypothetical protein
MSVSAVKSPRVYARRPSVARGRPPRELKQPNVYVCAIYVCTRGAWCVISRDITFAHLIAPGNMQLFWSSGVKSRPGGFIFTRNGQHFFQISQMVRTASFSTREEVCWKYL